MEGGRRSSTALLLLLALTLAISSTATAAGGNYKLITVETSLGDRVKLAVRAEGPPIAGFANNKNDWFNIQGSEDLLQPYRDRYGGGGGSSGIPSDGLVTLLGALVMKNSTS